LAFLAVPLARPVRQPRLFRSGTSHRLRIALNLKGIAYEQATVDLRREQHLTDAPCAPWRRIRTPGSRFPDAGRQIQGLLPSAPDKFRGETA
jgi:hypothetical protein